jgi:hypothetical protein
MIHVVLYESIRDVRRVFDQRGVARIEFQQKDARFVNDLIRVVIGHFNFQLGSQQGESWSPCPLADPASFFVADEKKQVTPPMFRLPTITAVTQAAIRPTLRTFVSVPTKIPSHQIVGVFIHERTEEAKQVQQVLTRYGENIKTRIGLRCRVGDCGLIILDLEGPLHQRIELQEKLSKLNGVTIKEMTFGNE